MTTTMSISEAREKLGTLAGLPVTSIEAAKILAALGITVAPEKPEPGIYLGALGTVLNRPVLVDRDATIYYLNDDGVCIEGSLHTAAEFAALTPARVVSEAEYLRLVNLRADEDRNPADAQYAPAEPPVITEEEVGELWDMQRTLYLSSWDKQPPVHRRIITATVNAALREHGGARELPWLEEVEEAISHAPRVMGSIDAASASIAVMALLGGGDRGE
ncbi:hypothetical protein ABDK96_01990 [Citricoccus nitrophenolicus]|uniref:SUKH-4 immunity protein of toxin-antitoxin system n=1 Tax=Citricoccus nitrophenolicus TaxID=863575 RepID=A0ABV0IE55_9MICC